MHKLPTFSRISSSERGAWLCVGIGLLALGCADSDKVSQPPKANEYFYDCAQSPTAIQNFATDESFVEFINKEVAHGLEVDDTQAPQLESPLPGSTISASVPPDFSFRVGTTAERARARAARAYAALAPRRLWASELFGLLLLEGVAHAHCAPVSGDNYLFRLAEHGSATPFYTAQLSVTRFVPGVDAWKEALRGREGKVVTLSLARAIYSGGTITNGPFIARVPIELTVGP